MSDWKTLLEWRNDLETRKNSHNMDLISDDQHKLWLKSTLDNPNRELFMYLENGVPSGTVRADWDSLLNSYILSWTISPACRGKGIGKRMVRLCADAMNCKLRAEIKKDNNASISIALHAGLSLRMEENGVLYFANYAQ